MIQKSTYLILSFIISCTVWANNTLQATPFQTTIIQPYRDTIPDTTLHISDDQFICTVETEAYIHPLVWKRYLKAALQYKLDSLADSLNIPPDIYKVNVRFIIEKDGKISNVHTPDDPGYGLGSVAIDIISKGPRHEPATHNGRLVRAYKMQLINFVIEKDDEKNRPGCEENPKTNVTAVFSL